MTRHWTALPNFVDCSVFRPVVNAVEKRSLCADLGIPGDAFVVGCVAAVKKHHKRIDYLINEFAHYQSVPGQNNSNMDIQDTQDKGKGTASSELSCKSCLSMLSPSLSPPYLLIVGSRTDETPELLALAESLIPGRYRIMTNCSRAQMPDLLRAMDVFVLTSLFEMMPIALLEGLATGLPVITNNHPVMMWMTGASEKSVSREAAKPRSEEILFPACGGKQPPFASSRLRASAGLVGGMAIDMSKEGELAMVLGGLTPEWIAEHGRQAQERAVAMFSKEAVIGQYVEYYREVMSDG